MPGSRVSVLSYPSEGHTFGPTLSYVTEDRYVDPIIEGHNPVTPPLSFVTGDHYVNPILRVHNASDCTSYYGSSLPVAADSVLSSENEEILLNLPDHEIERLLGPVQDEILSDESVLIIRDALTDASFSITAADMKNILVTHGRLDPDRENQYDYVRREEMEERRRNKLRIPCLLMVLLMAAISIGFAVTYFLTSKTDGPVVLIIGGNPIINVSANPMGNTQSIELYYPNNPSKNRVTHMHLPFGGWGYGGALVNNHTILLAGGLAYNDFVANTYPTNSLIRIDLIAGTADVVSYMNQRRWNPGAAVFHNKLFVCGGLYWDNVTDFNYRVLSSCEYYDIETQVWVEIKNMTTARSNFGLHLLNDRLLAIGGGSERGSNNTPYNSIEEYDFSSNKWFIVGQTPVYQIGQPSCSYDNKLILCGILVNQTWNYMTKCYSYNGTTFESLTLPQKASTGSSFVACGIDKQLLDIGGVKPTSPGNVLVPLLSVESFDGTQWSILPKPLLKPRVGSVAVCLDDSFLAADI